MMRTIFRPLLGRLILLLDRLARPRPILRSERELERLTRELRNAALYVRRDCPASVRLCRLVRTWNLPLELRDIRKSQVYHDDLLAGAGAPCTPCLRVEEGGKVSWLREVEGIAAFLGERSDTGEDARRKAPAPRARPLSAVARSESSALPATRRAG